MGRPIAGTASGSPSLIPRFAVIGGIVAVLVSAAFIVNLGGVRLLLGVGVPAVAPAPPPPPAPGLLLSATSIPQGGAFSVRLRSASLAAASVNFRDRDYSMVENGDQWYAVIGIGQPIGSEVMTATGDYPALISYQFKGGREVYRAQVTITVTPTDFPVDAIAPGAVDANLLTPELAASEGAQLQQAYSVFTPQQLWQGPFTEPVNGSVTTSFGARRSYEGGPVTGSHSGVDLGVPLGTPISASAAGKVAWTGSLPDRGNGVILDHGLGVFSGYFHMSQILATQGQSIAAGDFIGLAGSTGLSTGPHVHWEVVVGGVNVDGLQFEHLALP
jgi:murein DD-endopeptidase MepM/ murein hydrolase activator NlpD